jgi:hypothetical protein
LKIRKLISILLDMNAKERLGLILFILIFIGIGYLYRVNESLGFIVAVIFVAFILGIAIGGLNNNKDPDNDPCGNDNIKREPWKYM